MTKTMKKEAKIAVKQKKAWKGVSKLQDLYRESAYKYDKQSLRIKNAKRITMKESKSHSKYADKYETKNAINRQWKILRI